MPFRRTFGAEACALRGQPTGYGFVSTIDVRRCEALHRRWIAAVNYCASEPDRSVTAVYDAAAVHRHGERLRDAHRGRGLLRRVPDARSAPTSWPSGAGNEGSSLTNETSSAVHAPSAPTARATSTSTTSASATPTPQPTGGGVVMIGDSLTWRGSDELARLRPTFTLDGEPARKLTELKARLDFFRAGHGQPDGLIIELGTSPAPSFKQRDLAQIVDSVPAGTERDARAAVLRAPHRPGGGHQVVHPGRRSG